MLDEERDEISEEINEEVALSDDSGVDLGDDDLLFGEEEEGLNFSYGGAKGLNE